MEKEASGDTSGSHGGGGRTAQDSDVSGVTEADTSGNVAAGEKARWRGMAGDDGLMTMVEKAVDNGDEVDWEVVATADGAAATFSSPVRHAAARIGWLLLGFLAGAAVAAAVLLLMRDEASPVAACTVPT